MKSIFYPQKHGCSAYFIMWMAFLAPVAMGSETFVEKRGIQAIVNGKALSYGDVYDQSLLLLLLKGQPNTPSAVQGVWKEAIVSLTEEMLREDFFRKRKIALSEFQKKSMLEHLAKQNNLSLEAMKEQLKASGISYDGFKRYMISQFLWREFIGSKYRSQIKISPQEVEKALEVWSRENKDRKQYHILEIRIPGTGDASKNAIHEVKRYLQEGAPFLKLAMEYSQSPSKAHGGNLGWKPLSFFSKEEQQWIKQQKNPYSISEPILYSQKDQGGYSILLFMESKDFPVQPKPSAVSIEAVLFQEKLDVFAKKDMETLRSSAHIEMRV